MTDMPEDKKELTPADERATAATPRALPLGIRVRYEADAPSHDMSTVIDVARPAPDPRCPSRDAGACGRR